MTGTLYSGMAQRINVNLKREFFHWSREKWTIQKRDLHLQGNREHNSSYTLL